jgi:hypothetical protein
MDLFREILLSVEAVPHGQFWSAAPLLGYDIHDVVGHVRLIEDAGLAEARFPSKVGNEAAIVIRLTNAGYDFLEASKQKTLWENAKEKLRAAGIPMTVYTMQQVLDTIIKAHLPH